MKPGGVLLLVALAGCASVRDAGLLGPTAEEFSAFLAQRGVLGGFDHPLAATEEMREAAHRLAGPGPPRQRLSRLQEALFDESLFPFAYESEGTFTAVEAFERRQGNCLSFTNLFIALARALDIPVRGAFPVHRGSSDRRGDLIVVNAHVVATFRHGGGVDVFDFDRVREGPVRPVREIDDARLVALYLNNRGVEELRLGAVLEASRHFEAAVSLAPDFAGAWGNLGVARRRSGDRDAALSMYRRALDIEPADPTVLTNLATLYQAMGREREARTARSAADLRLAASHVLLVQGDLARADGEIDEALALYRRARRRAPGHPDPLVAVARAEWERGRPGAARRVLRKVLAKHADSKEARELLAAMESGGPATSRESRTQAGQIPEGSPSGKSPRVRRGIGAALGASVTRTRAPGRGATAAPGPGAGTSAPDGGEASPVASGREPDAREAGLR